MMWQLLIYIPQLSVIAIILLYPLRHNTRNLQTGKVCIKLLLFTSLVSSFYALKITLFQNAIFAKISFIPLTPISWGLLLSLTEIIVITIIIATLFIASVFLKKSHFMENMTLLAVVFSTLILISTLPDQLLRNAIFCIGSIAFTYTAINHEAIRRGEYKLYNDFTLQMAGDILAFLSILLLLKDNGIIVTERLLTKSQPTFISALYYASTICYLLSLPMLDIVRSQSPNTIINGLLIRKLLTSLGPQMLLLKLYPAIPLNKEGKNILLAISISIVIFSIFTTVIKFKKRMIHDHACNLFSSVIFACICAGFYGAGTCLMLIILILYPLTLISVLNKNSLSHYSFKTSLSSSYHPRQTVRRDNIAVKSLNISTQIIAYIFNAIYSSFLLFKAPQMILGMVQLPLRLIHNGNVQRSMAFVAIMFLSYIMWWARS